MTRNSTLVNGEGVMVGIDPARDSLQLSILPSNTGIDSLLEAKIPLTANSFKYFDELKQKYGQVTAAIEGRGLVGDQIVLELLHRGIKVLEVNPQISKKMRDIFTENHTDQLDSRAIAIGARSVDSLPEISTTDANSSIKLLVSTRAMLVDQKTANINRLHALLVQSYGDIYTELFVDIASKKALKFFSQFASIMACFQKREEIAKVLTHEKVTIIDAAGEFCSKKYMEALELSIKSLIGVIEQQKESIKIIENQIKSQSQDLEEVRLVNRELKIKYSHTIASIVTNIANIDRFPNEGKMAGFCGLAPVQFSSGKTNTNKPRKRYNRVLKKDYMLLAMTRIVNDARSREYYKRKRKQGMFHWQALLRLARQLCKNVYYTLKNYRKKLAIE